MKKLIALLLGSSLAGCCSGLDCPAPQYADYQVTLVDGDLCCLLNDTLHGEPQQLVKGQSNRGETAKWYTNMYGGDTHSNPRLEMELKAPEKPGVEDTVSMGAFTPNLDFGQEAAFTLRATFEYPDPVPSEGWAFAVLARTGAAEHDTPDLSRVQLSVRIRPSDIDVRVQEVDGENPVHKITIYNAPQGSLEYNAIKSGQPVTLKLTVNRKTGMGSAYLTIGTNVKSLENFPLTLFGVNSGPLLTTAGVALATDADWKKIIRVQVTDFRICEGEDNC